MPLTPKQQPPYYTPGTSGVQYYTANLTQTGTNVPTANVRENTTGQTITPQRSAQGLYLLNLETPILINRIYIPNGTYWNLAPNTITIPISDGSAINGYILIVQYDNTTHTTDIGIEIYNSSWILTEMSTLISSMPIEFRIYP